MQYNKQEKVIQQQHASPIKGSAIRARMLQRLFTAKMVRGVRFSNSLRPQEKLT